MRLQIGKWKSNKIAINVLAGITAALALSFFVLTVFSVTGCFDAEKYPNGTVIGDVDIGDMDRNTAEKLVLEAAEKMKREYRCVLHAEGADDIVLTNKELTVSFDAGAALDMAVSGGEYELVPSISEYSIRLALSDIIGKLAVQPESPTVEFTSSRYPDGERFWKSEGKAGREVDPEALIKLIKEGEREIDVPFISVPSLEEVALPKLIGKYETSFSEGSLSAKNRVYNIVKAAELVNGTRVKPHSTFSCNEILGARTEENGWKLAPGFTERGAGTVDQAGGGVCQLSSTLFNAALYADMTIVYRQAHSRMVKYVPPGRDATIDTDSIDFIWKNDTDSEVFVFAWVDTEKLTLRCEIYGQPKTDYLIEIETELTKTIPPTADEYELDETLSPDEVIEENPAVTGYNYNIYRVYYKDGAEIKRELISVSEYVMHPRRFRVGRLPQ